MEKHDRWYEHPAGEECSDCKDGTEKTDTTGWADEFDKQFGGRITAYSLFGTAEEMKAFITELLSTQKREIIGKLDWRNRTDGTTFNDGDDVIDWIDERIKELLDESSSL